jgi:hypothetical protein
MLNPGHLNYPQTFLRILLYWHYTIYTRPTNPANNFTEYTSSPIVNTSFFGTTCDTPAATILDTINSNAAGGGAFAFATYSRCTVRRPGGYIKYAHNSTRIGIAICCSGKNPWPVSALYMQPE